MPEISEYNGTEETGLVTPTPYLVFRKPRYNRPIFIDQGFLLGTWINVNLSID